MHRSRGTPARVARTSGPSTLGRWLRLGLPQRRVQDGPEMDDPTKQEEPKHARQNELNHGDEQAPLQQLPEAGHEEATERRNDVSRRSLPCHVASDRTSSSRSWGVRCPASRNCTYPTETVVNGFTIGRSNATAARTFRPRASQAVPWVRAPGPECPPQR